MLIFVLFCFAFIRGQETSESDVSPERIDELVQKLTETVTMHLQTEFTPETIATRLRLLADVALLHPFDTLSAQSVLIFLHDVVRESLETHDWSRQALADATLPHLYALTTNVLRALTTQSDNRVLSLRESRLLHDTLLSAAEALLQRTLAGEPIYSFDDDRLYIRLLKSKKNNLPEGVYGSDVNIENLFNVIAQVNGSEVSFVFMGFKDPLLQASNNAQLIRSTFQSVSMSVFEFNLMETTLVTPFQMTFALSPEEDDAPQSRRRQASNEDETEDEEEETLECVVWDIDNWNAEMCQLRQASALAATCDCFVTGGQFAVRTKVHLLPSAAQPLTELALRNRAEEGTGDSWLWLLLLLLLLLCCTLLIVACLVLYHRKNKQDDIEADTLQPYMDKAAGMGTLGLLVAGAADDVSDSSELEKRDYNLPINTVYEIPEATESSDLAREDFSLALSDESDGSELYNESAEAKADTDDNNVAFKEETRLKSVKTTTGTSRAVLKTDIDVSASIEHSDSSVPMQMGTEKELKRDTKTKATRD